MEMLGKINDITLKEGKEAKIKIRTVDEEGVIVDKREVIINKKGEIIIQWKDALIVQVPLII